MKSTIFWNTTPCSPLKVNWRFGGTYHLHIQGQRICRARNKCEAGGKRSSCSTYFSTLKMDALFSSETSVGFQLTTWRYIPEDSALHLRFIILFLYTTTLQVSEFPHAEFRQVLAIPKHDKHKGCRLQTGPCFIPYTHTLYDEPILIHQIYSNSICRRFLQSKKRRLVWSRLCPSFRDVALACTRWRWDNSFGIAMGYELDDWNSIPTGARSFSSPCRPDRFCSPPNFLFNGYWDPFLRG
jgi:hypothetical protein